MTDDNVGIKKYIMLLGVPTIFFKINFTYGTVSYEDTNSPLLLSMIITIFFFFKNETNFKYGTVTQNLHTQSPKSVFVNTIFYQSTVRNNTVRFFFLNKF